MATKIAINGFGRIGRLVLRALIESRRDDLQVVAINDLGPVGTNAHLFRYDSIHGRFAGTVTTGGTGGRTGTFGGPSGSGTTTRDGGTMTLMGADGPGKAEVAVGELARARLFCDDWEQASHGGELAAAVAAGLVARDDVTELGAVIAGDAEGRADDDDVTLFDSTGLAIQDLAIARAALMRSVELDLPRLEL